MHIDFKVTTWERVKIRNKDSFDHIRKQLDKKVPVHEIRQDLAELEEYEFESMAETAEDLEPVDTQGAPTVELYDDDGNCVSSNEVLPVNPGRNHRRSRRPLADRIYSEIEANVFLTQIP